MVSYIKTQWFNLALAAGALTLSIVNAVHGDSLMSVAWMVSFAYWVLNSYTDFNSKRIELLEKEKEMVLCTI